MSRRLTLQQALAIAPPFPAALSKDVLVVGGGMSAGGVPWETLPSHVDVVGCNAVFRETEVDYLVVVDNGSTQILEEALHTPGPREIFCEEPQDRHRRDELMAAGCRFFHWDFSRSTGPNCGSVALALVVAQKPERIWLLGFDGPGGGQRFVGSAWYPDEGAGIETRTWWEEKTRAVIEEARFQGIQVGEIVARHRGTVRVTWDEMLEAIR